MSNVVQIKRGSGKPDGKLAPYELGYDIQSQQLYIGSDLNSESGEYGEAILLGANKLKTTLLKSKVSRKNNQNLQIYCEGLVPGRQYTILLYTKQKSGGNVSRYWRHPSNIIPTENFDDAIGKFTGYANIASTKVRPDSEDVFPEIPSWMTRGGVLQTEWKIPVSNKNSQMFVINLNNWIKDLLKPAQANDPEGNWNLIGISNKKQRKLSRLFQFKIRDDETGDIGEATNFLTLSAVSYSNNEVIIDYFSIKN